MKCKVRDNVAAARGRRENLLERRVHFVDLELHRLRLFRAIFRSALHRLSQPAQTAVRQ